MQQSPKHPIPKGPVSHQHSRVPLILIGIGKLMKALGLGVIAYAAAYLINDAHHDALKKFLDDWTLDQGAHHFYWLFGRALRGVLSLDDQHLHLLRIGTLVYAGLFTIEGIGLILDKAWAEWMLVLTTGLLLPYEFWEVLHRRSPWPSLIFAFNVAVFVYVIIRLKWRMQDKRALKGPAPEVQDHISTLQTPAS